MPQVQGNVKLFTNSLRQKVALVGGGNDAREVSRANSRLVGDIQRAMEQRGHGA